MMTKPIRAVGYVRGSTDDGLNTQDAQREQNSAYWAFSSVELAKTVINKGESAVPVDFIERPVATMLSRMAEFGATAIIITKLDRGFRGATDVLLTTINSIRRTGRLATSQTFQAASKL